MKNTNEPIFVGFHSRGGRESLNKISKVKHVDMRGPEKKESKRNKNNVRKLHLPKHLKEIREQATWISSTKRRWLECLL